MLITSKKKIFKTLSLLTVISVSSWLLAKSSIPDVEQQTQSYIISAKQYELLKSKVAELNVIPSHELEIINALAVELTGEQLELLQQQLDVKVTTNHKVELSGFGRGGSKSKPKSVYCISAATPIGIPRTSTPCGPRGHPPGGPC